MDTPRRTVSLVRLDHLVHSGTGYAEKITGTRTSVEIAFSILKKQQAVAIQVAGRLSAEDVREMRSRTVEINRGRGVLCYVESVNEAFSWFEDMVRRY